MAPTITQHLVIPDTKNIFLVIYGTLLSLTAIAGPLKASLLPAEFEVPPIHEATNKDFVLRTAPALKQPCIALATHDRSVRALIPTALLRKLAAHAEDGVTNESERLMRIHGMRAKALLASALHDRDVKGCLRADLDGEAMYLLARLMDSGQITIFDVESKKVVTSVVVNVNAVPGIAGMVSYRLPDTNVGRRPFLAYQKWILH